MEESYTHIHHIKPCGMGRRREKREIRFDVIQPYQHDRVTVAMVMMDVAKEPPEMKLLYFNSSSDWTEADAPQFGMDILLWIYIHGDPIVEVLTNWNDFIFEVSVIKDEELVSILILSQTILFRTATEIPPVYQWRQKMSSSSWGVDHILWWYTSHQFKIPLLAACKMLFIIFVIILLAKPLLGEILDISTEIRTIGGYQLSANSAVVIIISIKCKLLIVTFSCWVYFKYPDTYFETRWTTIINMVTMEP